MTKLSAAGALVWARRVGNAASDIGYGVRADTDGNVIITGAFEGTVDFDPGSGVSA